MTLEKFAGEITFHCDDCETASEKFDAADNLTFQEAIARLKGEGWRLRRNDRDDEWEHVCPACAAAAAVDERGGRR